MSQKYEKLKTLLKELFQLDQPDLDFGLYRIMHAKAGEVTQFLEKDLLPQVKQAFCLYKSADKAELEKELLKAIEQAQGLGVDPETTQKVKDLRARLANDAVDIGMLENEVYDHLYSFFRRYYSEGDFLAKRVYKPGVYAIPYEGEEVKLHWANQDQYYIKTTEYLSYYSFCLRPDNKQNPSRVQFRLIDATEGEHGNVKAADERERVFILAAENFIAEENAELNLRFEYRPATLTDWPEPVRGGKTKPPTRKDLQDIAEHRVLTIVDASLMPWVVELSKPHVKADGEAAEYTRLRAHLNRYTARCTFDYFIHKDLGGFLKRELDFYIKNELMHLDDVENETASRVEQHLSKVIIVRRIAGKLINFLSQLEGFQKKIWLKKKFVIDSHYYVTLNRIPMECYPEIANNEAQRLEWVRLFGIDEIKSDQTTPDYSVPLTLDFLKAHQGLPVNTGLCSEKVRNAIIASIHNIDSELSGILFCGDNADVGRLLQRRYRQTVNTIYMDPPYNTQNREFPYKDHYQHSSWLSFLHERVSAMATTMVRTGVLLSSIDRNEMHRLIMLLDEIFGDSNRIAEFAWERGRKNDAKHVSLSHEYYLLYSSDWETLKAKYPQWREPKPALGAARKQFAVLRERNGDDFERVKQEFALWVGTKLDPAEARSILLYSKMDDRGPYRDDTDLSWPGGGGPRYPVINPLTGEAAEIPSRGWRFIQSTMEDMLAKGDVQFDPENPRRLIMKRYYFEDDDQVKSSVLYKHSKAATRTLRNFFGADVFPNPKDHELLADLFDYVTPKDGLILDLFAGSGTTAHAVIDLNRSRNRQMRFILGDLPSYFDDILIPRTLKSAYSPQWRDGKPESHSSSMKYVLKCIRIESYEDALNNLLICRSSAQQGLLETSEANVTAGLKEQYLLRYMLDVETRGSQSLLNFQEFRDPTAYTLIVKRPGSDESREANVDLLETFNWIIGLTVQHIAAPHTFTAEFERDDEKRLRLKGRLKQHPQGPWWFRTVTGTTPDGRKTLVIWRTLTGNFEQDNLVLDEWFTKQGYSTKDYEFHVIYVNGDNNLENLKAPDDTWKVRLIEEDFHRLMFDPGGI
jgi:adenine-specific DNA-methyltransferase